MNEALNIVNSSGQLAIAAVTIITVQSIKQTPLDNKYLPLIALGIGAVSGIFIGFFNKDVGMLAGGIDGIMAGGFSSGVYDSVKSLINKGDSTNGQS